MATYAGYSATGFEEIMCIVILEFIAIIGMIIYEFRIYPKSAKAMPY